MFKIKQQSLFIIINQRRQVVMTTWNYVERNQRVRNWRTCRRGVGRLSQSSGSCRRHAVCPETLLTRPACLGPSTLPLRTHRCLPPADQRRAAAELSVALQESPTTWSYHTVHQSPVHRSVTILTTLQFPPVHCTCRPIQCAFNLYAPSHQWL